MTGKSTAAECRIAVYAGSFDPFTVGHADIVSRGLALFDRIIVAVGVNAEKADRHRSGSAVATIEQLYADEPRVSVAAYTGLTVDFARAAGAMALLRGVRSVRDFEYERDMADVNMRLAGIDTVILFSRPDLAAVSASLVRELQRYGADVSAFLPHKV